MQLNNFFEKNKGVLFKSMFFIGLLLFEIINFKHSSLLIDVLYILVVIIFFIRFLVIKLYH